MSRGCKAWRYRRAAVRDGGLGGSVPVTLRVQLPQCSGAVHGFKLPACMAARVQGSQVALGGPRVGGVQERERERGVLNARRGRPQVDRKRAKGEGS